MGFNIVEYKNHLQSLSLYERLHEVNKHWEMLMAYEIVQKKVRGAGRQEQVSISTNGRQFLISSGAMKTYMGGANFVEIYVDRGAAGNEVKIGLHPTNVESPNTYSLVRPGRSKAGYVMAKATLSQLGYTRQELYPRTVEWVERNVNGKKTHLLEFGVERKFLK
jgi:hypothetical protein